VNLLTTTATLAELVTATPSAARVLERFGLDYCCGGRQQLADACADHALDPTEVLGALAALAPAPEPAWATMGPAPLVDHLEATHHAYLHTDLPRLGALVKKVAAVHGARHPELQAVEATYGELRADLEPHLLKEELVLFPMVRQLAAGSAGPCGSAQNPISVMLAEHDRVGEILEQLRRLTNGYSVPADGCASFRALYEGLAELETDTHLHVHKENNVLFPAVLALEVRQARA
jgi:regulator of cell morphogenesis and NO signaling